MRRHMSPDEAATLTILGVLTGICFAIRLWLGFIALAIFVASPFVMDRIIRRR
jgi:hypothetical protein